MALIGAGKFGSMYLAQVPKTPGLHLAAIADLSPAGATNGFPILRSPHPRRYGATMGLTWADVQADESLTAYKVRKEMEKKFF